MDNQSVTLDLGDTSLTLRFSWGVLEAIVAEWGEAWSERLDALFRGNPADLRFIAGLVAGRMFGPDTVLPAAVVINALYRAYQLAWTGVDIGEAEAPATGKKPGASRTPWWRRVAAISARAGRGRTSTP